jgi:hypothetical protein
MGTSEPLILAVSWASGPAVWVGGASLESLKSPHDHEAARRGVEWMREHYRWAILRLRQAQTKSRRANPPVRAAAAALAWSVSTGRALPRVAASIRQAKRTWPTLASLARAGGPRQGPAASAFATQERTRYARPEPFGS